MEFNSTDLKIIKASENWNFYLVLNCKDVSKELCWTMEQTVGKEHQNALKDLKTVVRAEEYKNRIWFSSLACIIFLIMGNKFISESGICITTVCEVISFF